MTALRTVALVFVLAGTLACGHYGPPVRTSPDAPEVENPAVKTGAPGEVDPDCEEEDPS